MNKSDLIKSKARRSENHIRFTAMFAKDLFEEQQPRYFYRLGQHVHRPLIVQREQMKRQNQENLLKLMKSNNGLFIEPTLRIEEHLYSEGHYPEETPDETWRSTPLFKEVDKDGYLSILKMELDILSRHPNMKGWHYPTVTMCIFPEIDIKITHGLSHVEIISL